MPLACWQVELDPPGCLLLWVPGWPLAFLLRRSFLARASPGATLAFCISGSVIGIPLASEQADKR